MTSKQIGRRGALTGLLVSAFGLGMGTAFTSRASNTRTNLGTSSTLVAYLSRSGNTRMIAESLARQLKADLCAIRTVEPYPEDYEAHVLRAHQQQETGELPVLAGQLTGFGRYRSVFLAFPVWGQNLPAPVRSFLAQYDVETRILFPCVTHGGYGPGRSLETLAQLAPNAEIRPAFIKQCDSERETLGLLQDWTGLVMKPEGIHSPDL